MSQLMFLFLSMSNSTIFMLMKHPMSMGITLLVQTVFICLVTNNMSQNAWFSYILFLVFLGGMLVLFIYMTSVASNEMFMKNKMSSFIALLMLNMLFFMMFMLIDPMLLSNNSEENMMIYDSGKYNSTSLMMSLFNYPNNMLTLFMVIYLFLTLIVVVKITESHHGPLRTTD
uniref:NADH dehydrogenase subunit 6 n=1 Tax=Ischnura senegalensis TaxID=126660 RepID=UPI001BF0242B|nr:NADH dehydrogenase subunit 6 [Ischnura senegalensis]QTZ98207.1 NADH dehydrogenase subunit 6 [Ischnura senegalensis]